MATTEYVSDPEFLQEFCLSEDLSQLRLDQNTVPSLREARLALLRPLERADILKSCTPPPVTDHDPYFKIKTQAEYLDLQPLSKMWRQELMRIPPFSRIIFDISLPQRHPLEAAGCDNSRIQWDIYRSRNSTPAIPFREVMQMATTIALTTRMRMKGEAVSFDIVYDDENNINDGETDEVFLHRMGMLRQQIIELGTDPSTRV
ncbi:hypothetical protein AAWM_05559 [Aspergillus awamori]|uniref:Uncharacterized protein n=1 Tax=Aspergillus awamori TaxID=105351 RepID=A0A401KTP8_ASPAW|nr:hypothetical protein AAWM_05559 [Aspergillus awamori]GKZ53741.1 hypothetical protein AnigIFM49718_007618 [Aspergillus niger]